MQLTPDLEALLRMGLAVLCGLAVGFNRAHQASDPHPNRLRVHVLVGLSSCLMVLAAAGGAWHSSDAASRAIQGVATGVGFLGAGEILVDRGVRRRTPPQVHGLTSAASIWFTASLGVTVAVSTPVLALAALGLALIVLTASHGSSAPPPLAAAEPPTTAERRHGQRRHWRRRVSDADG